MPELPEVETVRKGLMPLLGCTISSIEVRRRDLRRLIPLDFEHKVLGKRWSKLLRRGKHLIVKLNSGDYVLMHLGMSGRFRLFAPSKEPTLEESHTHVIWKFAEGFVLRHMDPRRFGWVDLCAHLEDDRSISVLGPDPLDITWDAATLGLSLRGRKTPIKSALLDQRVVAGLGNIYVCEILHHARISPRRSADSVSRTSSSESGRTNRIVLATREILSKAIKAGGSTLRDHHGVDGDLGYFPIQFRVYGRSGEQCLRMECNSVISRIVQNGRSTFFCPSCQR